MASASTKPKRSEPEPKEEKKSGPVFSRRVWTGTGSVEVAVFSKEIDGDNGPYQVFNVAVKRTWKDDEGYQSSNSFRPEDLLALAVFCEEAWSFISNENSKR